jgi:peroxiredoxin
VELREAIQEVPNLTILWVMADNQINARTRSFIDEAGLRDRIRFLSDPKSQTIDRLGLRLPDPEEMELGVPHPATYLLDEDGVIRFIDVREDYHLWLDPDVLVEALRKMKS